MRPETLKRRTDDQIRLVQEWMLSGMSQAKFAESRGIGLRALRYRICKIRKIAPESLTEESLSRIEFVQVPDEFTQDLQFETEIQSGESPVLTVQSSGVSLQVSGSVSPELLKTAMEVMLGC